ncbi:hypothetical protein C7S18_22570 [Ahniella affigens]|uniref:Outer membrane lipoprotein carrier protein LolA n=1 Tax=Ahniella affigens TaxID=2021234 RepID=A0A2P1PY69_9GAMM|nr:LolA-related protein [Ahniella affigens]AVP99786.1 hypothetical protein C7S18_22570 [Ahniella affigens]
MISGKRLVLILLALSLEWPSGAASATTIESLVAGLKREPPVHEPFAEFRFSRFTKKPAQSRGELQYLGPTHLVRAVQTPRPEQSTIANGMITIERPGQSKRQYALKRVPALAALLDSVTGLLGGDLARLQAGFAIESSDLESGFRLSLIPKQAAMQKRLSRIDVLGQGPHVHCLAFVEPDHEQSLLVLGDRVATLPADVTTVDALTQFCQKP